MDAATLGVIITVTLGYLTAIWYIAQSINKRIDDLIGEVRQFRGQSHDDLQTHTTSIADLRDRVTRLEKDA
jgi:hypothetical protein